MATIERWPKGLAHLACYGPTVVQVILLVCLLEAEGGTQNVVLEQPSAPASQPAAVAPPAAHPAARTGLAIAAAVVPGALVHGSGHFVAGHTSTGWALLKWQGIGLASLVGGFAGLAATGASRDVVGVFALASMAGAGLFLTTWLADLYGVMAPQGGFGGPMRLMPWLETQVGLRFVNDPALEGTTFFAPALHLRWQRWRLSPAAWIAADNPHSRWQLHLAYRLTGAQTGEAAPLVSDGSFVDLVLGAHHHRYAEPDAAFATRYRISGAEARVDGRLDLARIAPTLSGAFVEGSGGLGVGAYRYPNAGVTDTSAVLLGGFSFGAYFGRRADRWGEARVFYNHRHDDFVGGVKARGVGSGAIGYFGATAQAYVWRQFGLAAEVQAGAAIVTGLSLLYRHGRVAL